MMPGFDLWFVVFICAGLVYGILAMKRKEKKKEREENEIIKLYESLERKIEELEDGIAMSGKEWNEWLAIFEAADCWFKTAHRHLRFRPLAPKLQKIIRNRAGR